MSLRTESLPIETERAQKSLLDRVAPYVFPLALLGIPSSSFVALALLLQTSQFVSGPFRVLFLAAEVGSLVTLFVLVLLLRASLALPWAPHGFYRDVLDFLALSRWHPSVIAALIGLLVLPPAWYLSHVPGFTQLLRILGWRALRSGDVQSGIEGAAAVLELALTGGVPLLFAMHMLTRRKLHNRFLPWLLVPVLLAGTAAAVVFLVVLEH